MVSSERSRINAFALLSALLLCLSLSGCGGGEEAAVSPPAPTLIATPSPSPEPGLSYPAFPAELDGQELEHVYDVDGMLFLPVHSLCEKLSFALEWESGETGLSARLGETGLEAQAELEYMVADGRYLYVPEGWIAEDGGLWLPCEAASRLLNLSLSWTGDRLYIDASAAEIISGGEDYYDIHFDMDMLYWLPRIINAESMGQPLEGMIGVGNVVMNRMESPMFPNSITSVIYDRAYTVQFEPVTTGGLQTEPCEEAYIAAYLCLEGCNTVGESLFFVNPAYGSGWFDRELVLYKAIGDHNFYTYPEE